MLLSLCCVKFDFDFVWLKCFHLQCTKKKSILTDKVLKLQLDLTQRTHNRNTFGSRRYVTWSFWLSSKVQKGFSLRLINKLYCDCCSTLATVLLDLPRYKVLYTENSRSKVFFILFIFLEFCKKIKWFLEMTMLGSQNLTHNINVLFIPDG